MSVGALPMLSMVTVPASDPDAALFRRVHVGGALAAWQVGSAAEARIAAESGCDFIVAQGIEAGGHLPGQGSLLPYWARSSTPYAQFSHFTTLPGPAGAPHLGGDHVGR